MHMLYIFYFDMDTVVDDCSQNKRLPVVSSSRQSTRSPACPLWSSGPQNGFNGADLLIPGAFGGLILKMICWLARWSWRGGVRALKVWSSETPPRNFVVQSDTKSCGLPHQSCSIVASGRCQCPYLSNIWKCSSHTILKKLQKKVKLQCSSNTLMSIDKKWPLAFFRVKVDDQVDQGSTAPWNAIEVRWERC